MDATGTAARTRPSAAAEQSPLPPLVDSSLARWRPTARLRILGWAVLTLAAALAISTTATHWLLTSRLDDRVHEELIHEADEFRALQTSPGTPVPGAGPTSVATLLRTAAGRAVPEASIAFYGIVDGQFQVHSSATPPADLTSDRALLATWSGTTTTTIGSGSTAAGPIRYVVLPAGRRGDDSRGVFVAVIFIAADQADINQVTALQVEVGFAALGLAALLAWLIAGRILRPVRATTELARRITDADLGDRIPVRGHDEISELAATFNRMLDRLQASASAQRAFLADAGHELRTPITIVQGNLDTLLTTDSEDLETLAIATDELQRMARMVDDLLMLARSEHADFLRLTEVDAQDLGTDLAAKLGLLSHRPVTTDLTAHGRWLLDRDRIAQAVLELGANAVNHTPPGSPLHLITRSNPAGTLRISLADRGPGIPEAQQHRIFDRFARLDRRRTDGTGLGLSIVSAIAHAHAGTITATNRPGGGAVFELTIRPEHHRTRSLAAHLGNRA